MTRVSSVIYLSEGWALTWGSTGSHDRGRFSDISVRGEAVTWGSKGSHDRGQFRDISVSGWQ